MRSTFVLPSLLHNYIDTILTQFAVIINLSLYKIFAVLLLLLLVLLYINETVHLDNKDKLFAPNNNRRHERQAAANVATWLATLDGTFLTLHNAILSA